MFKLETFKPILLGAMSFFCLIFIYFLSGVSKACAQELSNMCLPSNPAVSLPVYQNDILKILPDSPSAKIKEVSMDIAPQPKPEPKAVVLIEAKPKVQIKPAAVQIRTNPNYFSGVGKPSRILADLRVENGIKVCGKKNDKPKKSDKNPPGQVDGECCLDPDEIPNSLCHYSTEKYGNLIARYLNRGKK